VLAHERAHILLHGCGRAEGKSTYLREIESERWAHAALRRHGVNVPKKETLSAIRYIRRKMRRAQAAGVRIDPAMEALFIPRR
jgi:hypothetical protein